MNLATQLTVTPSSLPLTMGKGKVHAPLDADPTNDVEILDACRAEMIRADADYRAGRLQAIQAAVALGDAARTAKDAFVHGSFVEWVEREFTFSPQWVRTCMRTSEVWQIATEQNKMDMLEGVSSVEGVAKLLRPLQGAAPIVAAKRKPAPAPVLDVAPKGKGKPAPWDNVTDVAPKGGTIHIPPTDASLKQREADCVAFEKKLDKREAKLNARVAELDERERLLALRESDVAAREQALTSAAPVDEAPTPKPKRVRKAKAQSAPATDEAGQEGADQDEGAPHPAQTGLNGSTASGTVEQDTPM